MPSPWTVIDSKTLSVAASSVSFTGISSSYRMFRITAYIVKDATGSALGIRLNNDSGTNYDYQRLNGQTTTVSAVRTTGASLIGLAGGTANGISTLSAVIAKQVTGSAAMAVIDETAYDGGSGVIAARWAGRWNNTLALISRIDLISSSGNFAAGTTVVLEAM